MPKRKRSQLPEKEKEPEPEDMHWLFLPAYVLALEVENEELTRKKMKMVINSRDTELVYKTLFGTMQALARQNMTPRQLIIHNKKNMAKRQL